MATKTIRVRALRHGFHGTRRRVGAEFSLTGEVDPKTGKPKGFANWMMDITDGVPGAASKAKDSGEMSRKELIEALKELEIDIPPRAPKEDLKTLYDTAVKAVASEGDDEGGGGGDGSIV